MVDKENKKISDIHDETIQAFINDKKPEQPPKEPHNLEKDQEILKKDILEKDIIK